MIENDITNKKKMDPNCSNRHLINKLDREQLDARLAQESFKRITLSFYRYVIISNPQTFRNELYSALISMNCFGRIYVAHEGINAQMSVPEFEVERFKNWLNSLTELKDMPLKIAVEDDGKSFNKLSVKVRKQIVADGLFDNEYDVTNVGKHLSAKEWNQAMDEKSIVVDMRNHYESEIGRFDNAILPKAETFREELPMILEELKDKKDKKILLYCTGGVRCEKTSAYLKHHGFTDVNQLLGGIIDYSRQIKEEGLENKFKGKNFVFDNRLGERISNEVISKCHQCGKSCDTHNNCINKGCNLLFIQCDECAASYNKCCSTICMNVVSGTISPQDAPKFGSNKRFFRVA